MRVLSGTASGIILDTPRGIEVRPTGARARGALFDSIASTKGWNDAVVVDLFAGSGALGLEAASRGASIVRLIEKSPKHLAVIDNNIAKVLKAGSNTDITAHRGNALSAHRLLPALAGTINYIFADPPYADFASSWQTLLNDAGFAKWAGAARMIWETPPNANPDIPEGWTLVKRESRGGTTFTHVSASRTKYPSPLSSVSR